MNIDPQTRNDIISRWKNGQSIRGISAELNLGRKVVANAVRQHVTQTQATQASSLDADSQPHPPSLGPAKLVRPSKLDRYIVSLQQLIARYPNITAQRAFEELSKLGYEGSYSTLRTYMKEQRIKPKALVVRFETPPGAQAQMDWSTYTIEFTHQGRRKVQLFSYILSYSRRQYLHFTDRQDFETTVRQHVAAFEHLGGAAATCLYDNMKVVVSRWEDGQPIYNPRFLSFATHYGFKPWACEPRRPVTKGKVERPFDYAEKNLLNGRTFRTMEHLNEVANWWLAQVNDVRLHGTTKRQPLELHAEEAAHLIELPTIRFDAAQVVYRRVDSEGFISFADNRYSVPWRLTGHLVPVRILEDQLEIYNTSVERVACHNLSRGKHEKLSQDAHRPPSNHQEQLAILREKYLPWGPTALEYFEGTLRKSRNGRHEAQRVLSLLHAYPKKDGMAALERAVQYHAYGYHSLERILSHIGTPKPHWELLSQREQEALQRITESTRVEARSSKEYQDLIDQENMDTEKEVSNDGERRNESRSGATEGGAIQSGATEGNSSENQSNEDQLTGSPSEDS